MMDDELLSKFDSLKDLPISEEMLGAYIEGTLSYHECNQIEDILATNNDFALFFNDVSDYNEVSEGSFIPALDLSEVPDFSALFETNVAEYESEGALNSVDIFQDMGVAADDSDGADSFINPDSTSSFDTGSIDLDLFDNTNSDIFDTDISLEDDQLFE